MDPENLVATAVWPEGADSKLKGPCGTVFSEVVRSAIAWG